MVAMAIWMRLFSTFLSSHRSRCRAGLGVTLLVVFSIVGCNDQHAIPCGTSHRSPGTSDALQKASEDTTIPELTESEAKSLAEARARQLWKDWECTWFTKVQVLSTEIGPEDGGGWQVVVGFPADRPTDWVELVVTPKREVLRWDEWFQRTLDAMSPEEREWGRQYVLELWTTSSESPHQDQQEVPCQGSLESEPH